MTFDMQVSGLLTLVLSAAGCAAAFVGWYIFRNSKAVIGQKMRHYLVAHGALFFITMCFGLAGMINAPLWVWHVIYHARVMVLCLEGFFLVTLVKEFYHIENQP